MRASETDANWCEEGSVVICYKCGIDKENQEFKPGAKQCRKCANKAAASKVKEYKQTEKYKQYMLGYNKTYKEVHSDEHKEYMSRYNSENRDKLNEWSRTHIPPKGTLKRFKLDLRRLIGSALHHRSFTKRSRTHQLLGCSYEEFMIYLGPQPEGKIHLDHICPCAQAQNEEELLKLQHYSNFRWLPAEENLKKSAKRTPESEEMCKVLLGREWID